MWPENSLIQIKEGKEKGRSNIFLSSTKLLGIHPGLSRLQNRWLLRGGSGGGIASARVLLGHISRGDAAPPRLKILFAAGELHGQLACVKDFTIYRTETKPSGQQGFWGYFNTQMDKQRKKRWFEKYEYKCKNTDFSFRFTSPRMGAVTVAESPVLCHRRVCWERTGAAAGGCRRHHIGLPTGLKADVNELVLMGTLMARGQVR